MNNEHFFLENFNFQNVNIDKFEKMIIKKTEYTNLFLFFMDLFSYCYYVSYFFEKTQEKYLIQFVFQHMDRILLNRDSSIKDIEDILFCNHNLVEFIIYYILKSENYDELRELITILDKAKMMMVLEILEKMNTVKLKERKEWIIQYIQEKIHDTLYLSREHIVNQK